MFVLLNSKVINLGNPGDIVKVKPGFGRNFLIPRGLASLANVSNKKMYAHQMRIAQDLQQKSLAKAQGLAASLSTVEIVLHKLAGVQGKIFGSITTIEIAKALQELNFSISKKDIDIEVEIRSLGEHSVNIKLHKEVTVAIKVKVVAKD
jgi:large subunit ribosomal protein L9